MCPESVVAGSDAETGCEVVGNGPEDCLQLHRYPKGLYATIQRDADDEVDIEPVDVLVEVRLGHRRLCDVHLLRVVLGVSVGF